MVVDVEYVETCNFQFSASLWAPVSLSLGSSIFVDSQTPCVLQPPLAPSLCAEHVMNTIVPYLVTDYRNVFSLLTFAVIIQFCYLAVTIFMTF